MWAWWWLDSSPTNQLGLDDSQTSQFAEMFDKKSGVNSLLNRVIEKNCRRRVDRSAIDCPWVVWRATCLFLAAGWLGRSMAKLLKHGKGHSQSHHGWSNSGSFISRPPGGWLHPDDQLLPNAGICYGVRVSCAYITWWSWRYDGFFP